MAPLRLVCTVRDEAQLLTWWTLCPMHRQHVDVITGNNNNNHHAAGDDK